MGREVCPQGQVQIQSYENEAGASKRKLPERGPQFNRHLIHTGEGTFCAAYMTANKLQSVMSRNFTGRGGWLIFRRLLMVVVVCVSTAIAILVVCFGGMAIERV